jgi:hypothetical protein
MITVDGNATYGREFWVDAFLGNVPNFSVDSINGYNTSVPNGASADISDQGGRLVPPSTDVAFEVVSDSASDDIARTGVQIVAVTLLDPNWEEVTAIVVMDGTTPVSIPGTYIRARSVVGAQSGGATAGQSWNIGNVDVREVVGGQVHLRMTPEQNSSFSGFYSVPANKIVRAINVAPLVAKNDEARLQPYLIQQGGNTISGQPIPLFEGNISLKLFNPLLITEMQDFVFRAESLSSGTADVAIIVELLVEDV